MTDHFGQVIDYGYDSRSRLNTVKAGTNTTSYGYYLNGSLKSIAYPGAITEEYSYDGAINLKTLTNKKSGTVIDQFAYTYDGAGNQKSKTENGQSVYYGYNALNRVQTVSSTNAVQPAPQDMIAAYTYDSAGNIDNMYSENFSVGVTADYTFNELNQLTQYTESERSPVSYTYYPNGLRKTKAVDGITTTYYYDGQNVIIETENGSLKYRNIYGMNQIARQDAAGNLYYFLYNEHGDVVKLVDSTGNIKNRYEYDIYGKVINAVENGIPNPMRYAGQYYDSESGLYYLRARYYDPRVGRFISEDTNKGDINNPSSLNLYTYCWGNPLNYIDFDGHNPQKSFWVFLWGAYKGVTGSERVSAVPIAKSNTENKLIENDKSTMFNVGKLSSTVVYNNDLVFDASVSTYYVTVGYSKVVSLKKDIDADYIHIGAGQGYSLQPVSFTASCGIANGVDEASDYAEFFHDVSASGMIGIDYCYWPNGAEAWLVTMGNDVSIGTRLDYYILIKDNSGKVVYQIVPEKAKE